MSTTKILYRAVSHAELLDIIQTGGMRPAPPSNQGKWFAESSHDACRWGHFFYQISQLPFHIIALEVPSALADQWYRNALHDRIGPAVCWSGGFAKYSLRSGSPVHLPEMIMTHNPHTLTRVRWRTVGEGGRDSPPSGPLYPTAARFDNETEVFSIVLRLLRSISNGDRPEHEAELQLLAPDLMPDVASKLIPGSRLVVKEGGREVADCEVVAVTARETSPVGVPH